MNKHIIYFGIVCIVYDVSLTTGCSQTFIADQGVITSPNYPASYPANTRCTYKIKVATGKRIRLQWTVFKVDGEMVKCDGGDYVIVSAGCSSPKVYSRYCNDDTNDYIPHDMYSRDECMQVYFYSNQVSSNFVTSFQATYTTYSKDVAAPTLDVCGGYRLRSLSGILMSPGWPHTYKLNQQSCSVRIYIDNKKLRIKLAFMQIDTYAPNSGKQRCDVQGNDVLKFRAKHRLSNKYDKFKYCNRQDPFYRYYSGDYSYIDVTFERVQTVNNSYSGFVVGYVLTKIKDVASKVEEEEGSAFKWWMVAIPIVVLILMCCTCQHVKKHGGVRAIVRNHIFNPTHKNKGLPMPVIQKQNAYTTSAPTYPPPSYQTILTGSNHVPPLLKEYNQQASAPPYPPSLQTSATAAPQPPAYIEITSQQIGHPVMAYPPPVQNPPEYNEKL